MSSPLVTADATIDFRFVCQRARQWIRRSRDRQIQFGQAMQELPASRIRQFRRYDFIAQIKLNTFHANARGGFQRIHQRLAKTASGNGKTKLMHGQRLQTQNNTIDQASIVNGRRSESKEVSRSDEPIRFGILVISKRAADLNW
jgi:hypothetical protein